MSTKVRAAIRGEMLEWARVSSGYTPDQVAVKMGSSFTPERILSLESDEEKPTFPQVKHLASIYGRHQSLFYLPEPPEEPPLPADYRLGAAGPNEQVSPQLRKLVRKMHDLRASALDLADDLDETHHLYPKILFHVSIESDPRIVAARTREWLGVSIDEQSSWETTKVAFEQWRESIEDKGVFVFVELGAHSVSADEVRGFSIAEEIAPVIMVNNLDSKPAQVFTLFHELGHILLNEQAFCLDMDIEVGTAHRSSRVEAWCNQFAGELLVPRETLMSLEQTAEIGRRLNDDPTDPAYSLESMIQDTASYFSVSPEVIIRRLSSVRIIRIEIYLAWRDQWYIRHPIRKPPRSKKGGPTPAILAPTRFGMKYLSLLYSAYWSDGLSAIEVGDYVGGSVKTVHQLEEKVRKKLFSVAQGA